MTMLLLVVPIQWSPLWTTPLAEIAPDLKLAVDGRDAYDKADVDYVLSFRPAPGSNRRQVCRRSESCCSSTP